MKKIYSAVSMMVLAATMGLFAQGTTLKVQIEKDGKVVKDTLYEFDDEKEAEHALKMMELVSDDELHEIHKEMKFTHSSGEAHGAHTMVFISEDGEKKVIKGDGTETVVWTEEGEGKEKQIRVKVKTDSEGDEIHEEIIVMKDGEKNVWIEDGDGEKAEHIIVMKKDGEATYELKLDSDEDIHMEKEVTVEVDEESGEITITTESDGEVEVRKMKLDEVEGDDVKVIVVKKEVEKDCDQDHDKEVEVKVKKKKSKKQ